MNENISQPEPEAVGAGAVAASVRNPTAKSGIQRKTRQNMGLTRK